MLWRITLLLGLSVAAMAAPVPPGKDPMPSVMWQFYQQRMLGDAPFVFDDKVLLEVPPFAEDARQVPIQVDARAYAGQVQKIVAWAELNPIPRIFTFVPGERVQPLVAIRIRVEQATPIRAAVLTKDGVWHVGSAWVDAAGGGCTAPSVVRAQVGWEDRLGQIHAGRFRHAGASRLRLRVDHPMDNGLVGGIPEFFLNQAELRDAAGKPLATLELFPAVSENPTISLEVEGHDEARLWLRDNNGNEFEADF
ncbi:quinoprotein dehydrogenase-associated SoxYZ-like carrier [Pseudomonas cavernicola]|uniref:Quinoprotein dehydrogenase-associated SoxYZ-like carrier n=1 Tax=Pseudomonas cavernicola TaxID=2320866 RepID=A0A418X868_9PSED|nr:quinoprotein dehydrogenase-associated SoxYZ-like carrier [Pseudomonas cavernicola]RJG08684.1 quinoprotein dehydrogenase-associated SoxYZ-like carrier [Pseudomonas cavernicola]